MAEKRRQALYEALKENETVRAERRLRRFVTLRGSCPAAVCGAPRLPSCALPVLRGSGPARVFAGGLCTSAAGGPGRADRNRAPLFGTWCQRASRGLGGASVWRVA